MVAFGFMHRRINESGSDMSRLEGIGRDDLDDNSQGLWDEIVRTRGSGAISSEGHLIGPFNPWLRAPAVGIHLQALGSAVRSETSLDPVVTEIAILTVVSHWGAEFEWQAHAAMAKRLDVSDAVLEALRHGQDPDLPSELQRIAHTACKQIVRNGSLDEATYFEVHGGFGDRGTVELVSLCGYYSAVSFVINTFVVLPPGSSPEKR
jgi:4-carboxymuconolactone decarboxylase